MSEKQIWIVSREYAGIAEAGGVKNVTTSLAENLVKKGFKVLVFIPEYACANKESLENYTISDNFSVSIPVNADKYTVSAAEADMHGVKIVFIRHAVFLEKNAVYTYTKKDEAQNPEFTRGLGFKDAHILNILHQKAVLEYALFHRACPCIIHCQDAATALLSVFAHEISRYKKLCKKTGFLTTIHNAGPGYHHHFSSLDEAAYYTKLSSDILKKGLCGERVEPFLLASFYSKLSTVSPWYAEELLDPQYPYSDGLSPLFAQQNVHIQGILNGIEYDKYDPKNTSQSCLSQSFNPLLGKLKGKYKIREALLEKIAKGISIEAGVDSVEQFGSIDITVENPVFFSYHGRIVWQKGLDVLAEAIPLVLTKNPQAYFIIIGQGQPELEDKHIALANQFPGRYVYLRGYERSLTRECLAASDFLVLPSFFEPCGLEDFIGQIFASLPIAHAVGGLQKIDHGETGFLYEDNTGQGLAEALLSAIHLFNTDRELLNAMIIKASYSVKHNYTWQSIVEEYTAFYQNIVNPQSKLLT